MDSRARITSLNTFAHTTTWMYRSVAHASDPRNTFPDRATLLYSLRLMNVLLFVFRSRGSIMYRRFARGFAFRLSSPCSRLDWRLDLMGLLCGMLSCMLTITIHIINFSVWADLSVFSIGCRATILPFLCLGCRSEQLYSCLHVAHTRTRVFVLASFVAGSCGMGCNPMTLGFSFVVPNIPP